MFSCVSTHGATERNQALSGNSNSIHALAQDTIRRIQVGMLPLHAHEPYRYLLHGGVGIEKARRKIGRVVLMPPGASRWLYASSSTSVEPSISTRLDSLPQE